MNQIKSLIRTHSSLITPPSPLGGNRRDWIICRASASLFFPTFPRLHRCAAATCRCCRSPAACEVPAVSWSSIPAQAAGSSSRQRAAGWLAVRINQVKICNRGEKASASAARDEGRKTWQIGFRAAPLWSTDRCVLREIMRNISPCRC